MSEEKKVKYVLVRKDETILEAAARLREAHRDHFRQECRTFYGEPLPQENRGANPTAEFVDVTPEMAAAWLQNNKNRKIIATHVAALKKEMVSGHWVTGLDQIAFDRHGNLLEGQHRLTALVELGVTLKMLVVRGLDDLAALKRGTGVGWRLVDRLGKTNSAGKLAVEVASFIQTRLLQATPLKPSTEEILKVLQWCEPVHQRLSSVCGRIVPRRSAAPVRTAAVLRMAVASETDAEKIARQYRAFVNVDTAVLSPVMTSFLKQITDVQAVDRADIFARAWTAFDLNKQNVGTVLIKDPRKAWEDARAVARYLTPS
jgi:hypothetical protein